MQPIKGKSPLVMRKTAVAILAIVLALGSFWAVALAKCELLTFFYGEELKNSYVYTDALNSPDKFKVLRYSNEKARVYYLYIDKESNMAGAVNSSIIDLRQSKTSWEVEKWSSWGPDKAIWPYLLDSPRGIIQFLELGILSLILVFFVLFFMRKKLSEKSHNVK